MMRERDISAHFIDFTAPKQTINERDFETHLFKQ